MKPSASSPPLGMDLAQPIPPALEDPAGWPRRNGARPRVTVNACRTDQAATSSASSGREGRQRVLLLLCDEHPAAEDEHPGKRGKRARGAPGISSAAANDRRKRAGSDPERSARRTPAGPTHARHARDPSIAGSDICAALLLPMPERPKQKRDARRVHACGVCAWVRAELCWAASCFVWRSASGWWVSRRPVG